MSPYRGTANAALALLLVGGCSASGLNERLSLAEALASARSWQALSLETESFRLMAWVAPVPADSWLTIYIEGDGFAWANRSRPSSNPTPRQPMGLKLALRHPFGNAAYLARPCQYVVIAEQFGCERATWTSERFSEPVIEATDQAISLLKAKYQADRLTLVGYSGGGAVATLVAARRNDVHNLVTVAGVLDHELWTRNHRLSPLTGSLNPADVWSSLTDIAQIHYVGLADEIIDESLAESFRSRFPEPQHIRIEPIPDFDHVCCWVDAWSRLATPWAVRTSTHN